MKKKRLIPVDLFEDYFFGSVDYICRLAWIGIIVVCADDQGRFLDNPAIIRAKIFSQDNDIKDDEIESILSLLEAVGEIIRYKIINTKLIQIVHWREYQMPSLASPSQYPAPEGWIDMVK